MPGHLSKSQIERLGLRLIREKGQVEADLELLRQLLLARSEILDRAVSRIRDGTDASPTSRIKNTGTVLEKLRRNGGSGLKSMQDLAGMRIVGDFDRKGQDQLAERVVALFRTEEREPKLVDRRVQPMHGYSAVHVIVFPEGVPIEIQIRTRWQHEWAELFEKLADLVGRGIRYGEPPMRWWTDEGYEALSQELQAAVSAEYEVRKSLVEIALAVAGLISAVEEGEVVATEDPKLDDYRRRVNEALADLREELKDLA